MGRRRGRPHADACAPFGFGFAESSLRKLRFLRRISRQSLDCLRVRLSRAAIPLREVRSACGGDAARGLHVCVLRFSARLHSARMLAHPSGSASPNLPSASLRRISADSSPSAMRHPSANAACMAWSRSSRRPATPPRGVWRTAAPNLLRPRGRRTSPSHANGTCRFSTAQALRLRLPVPQMRYALKWLISLTSPTRPIRHTISQPAICPASPCH